VTKIENPAQKVEKYHAVNHGKNVIKHDLSERLAGGKRTLSTLVIVLVLMKGFVNKGYCYLV